MSDLLFSAGGLLLGGMSEQLALLVPCSSQAAPGTLTGDDASPVPVWLGLSVPKFAFAHLWP